MHNKPIQRHAALQPLSREHHFGLLFCWKIRTGLIKSIESVRIKNYADWFFKNHLLSHFESEEKYIFPILGNKNEFVKRALSEHRKIKRLFKNETEIIKSLTLIEEELENHIRFEERVLFNKIQESINDKELLSIELLHSDNRNKEDWQDQFWA